MSFDLTAVYGKTSKGVMAVSSKGKGLNSELMRVLSLVDGKSSVEEILASNNKFSDFTLHQALTQLAHDGYLKVLRSGPNTVFALGSSGPSTILVAETDVEAFFAAQQAMESRARDAVAEQERSLEESSIRRASAAQSAAEEQAKAEAEAKALARIAAERKAREEAAARAREEVEARARAEAEAREKARREAEAKKQAEEEARKEAERRAREEAEAQARRKAEERAKAAAAAKAKAEAERQAREEAEARAIAETIAKKEAERKARAEAEAKAQAEAEERSRRETEEQARLKAEEEARKALEETAARAKAESEARKRQEAEEKTRRDAEEKARKEAERRAREEVEARAKAEAEERKRREAEEKATRKAEEKARKEAERKAREEAEAKARIEAEALRRQEAEEKARIKAEENARKEAERRAREEAEAAASAAAEERKQAEAEEKAKAKAAARARKEAAAQAKAEEKRKAREAAEAKAMAEAEERRRHKAEEQARIEAEKRARENAAAKARMEADEEARERHALEDRAKALAESRPQKTGLAMPLPARKTTKPFRPSRPAMIALALLIAVPLVLLHVASLNMFAPSIAKLASDRIGEPVTIGSVRASLWPAPHLRLEGVTVGPLRDVKIATVRVMPVLTQLFSEHKTLKSLEVESLSIDQSALHRVPGWVTAGGNPVQIQAGLIHLKNTRINLDGMQLPLLDMDIRLTPDNRLEHAHIRSADEKIAIDVTPRGDAFELKIAAKNWQPPLGPSLTFDELAASASAGREAMQITEIEGQLYGGTLKGKASVSWEDRWHAAGSFDIARVAMDGATPAFTRNIKLNGTLDASAAYSMEAASLPALFDAPRIKASFNGRDGDISGFDLARAIAEQPQAALGGKTRFTALSGNMALSGKRYQFRRVRLADGPLKASGNIDVVPDKALSGTIAIEMALKAGTGRARLLLSGNLGQPEIQ